MTRTISTEVFRTVAGDNISRDVVDLEQQEYASAKLASLEVRHRASIIGITASIEARAWDDPGWTVIGTMQLPGYQNEEETLSVPLDHERYELVRYNIQSPSSGREVYVRLYVSDSEENE